MGFAGAIAPHTPVIVAAADTGPSPALPADLTCTGMDDQRVIQAALNAIPDSGGVVVLLGGRYNLTGHIYPKGGTTLRGMGEDRTELSFMTTSGIRVERGPGTTVSDLSVTGKGSVLVSESGTTVRNVLVRGVDNSYIAAFVVYVPNTTVSGLTFDNCRAVDIDRWGFVTLGEGPVRVIRDSIYRNCQSINAGRHARVVPPPGESWDVGFSIAEEVTLVENVTYEGCVAEGSWESGFHVEDAPVKSGVTLVDCVSRDNGQKEKSGSGKASYGAGFMVDDGMTLVNCSSEGNIAGFRISGGRVIGCRDLGSVTGFLDVGIDPRAQPRVICSVEGSEGAPQAQASAATAGPVQQLMDTILGMIHALIRAIAGAGQAGTASSPMKPAGPGNVGWRLGINNCTPGLVKAGNLTISCIAEPAVNCRIASVS